MTKEMLNEAIEAIKDADNIAEGYYAEGNDRRGMKQDMRVDGMIKMLSIVSGMTKHEITELLYD